MALRNEGVKCVAARSISRIFERNLASAGIFPLTIYKNDNIHLSEYLFEDVCGSAEIKIKPLSADKTVSSEIKLSVGGRTLTLRAETDIFFYEIASAGGMVSYIASDKRR
jgi:3-isopropylmalate dehydratase small subunit